MCYASTESLGLSELNYTNIISFGVPERICRADESTNFITIVFTLPHIMASKFANQLLIGNVGRTCNGSGNVWNWKSRSRCTRTLENVAPHKIRCDIFSYYFASWRCYPCNLYRNHLEKRWLVAKTNASKLLVCCLENSRFRFQKLLSDLKSKSKTAAVIMTWLSQGMPFIYWNVGTYIHFWIPRSPHE